MLRPVVASHTALLAHIEETCASTRRVASIESRLAGLETQLADTARTAAQCSSVEELGASAAASRSAAADMCSQVRRDLHTEIERLRQVIAVKSETDDLEHVQVQMMELGRAIRLLEHHPKYRHHPLQHQQDDIPRRAAADTTARSIAGELAAEAHASQNHHPHDTSTSASVTAGSAAAAAPVTAAVAAIADNGAAKRTVAPSTMRRALDDLRADISDQLDDLRRHVTMAVETCESAAARRAHDAALAATAGASQRVASLAASVDRRVDSLSASVADCARRAEVAAAAATGQALLEAAEGAVRGISSLSSRVATAEGSIAATLKVIGGTVADTGLKTVTFDGRLAMRADVETLANRVAECDARCAGLAEDLVQSTRDTRKAADAAVERWASSMGEAVDNTREELRGALAAVASDREQLTAQIAEFSEKAYVWMAVVLVFLFWFPVSLNFFFFFVLY
jgi:hypothetical protein